LTEDKKLGQQSQGSVPKDVLDVLKSAQIGYLSVTSAKGEIFSYPVAFYFSKLKFYFMTPISAAKLKFVRANPSVSFLVDNHLLTKGACGAMIQGNAKVFSIAKTVLDILSVGPKMAHFAKKYPGMFTFYASGKELPDERKLYKYRLIRIDPIKILYWQGYKFGRYLPGNPLAGLEADPLSDSGEELKMQTLAELMISADRELPSPQARENPEWVTNLDQVTRKGEITEEEKLALESYRSFLRRAAAENVFAPTPSKDEKKLLKKWREQSLG
jgi:hypothetical protein